MSKGVTENITFAQLDQKEGTPQETISREEEFPLQTWYRTVKDTPIVKLSIGDIGKACGQSVHLTYTIPVLLDYLQTNVLAGEMYDGELLFRLANVPSDFWKSNQALSARLQQILLRSERFEAETERIVQELLLKSGNKS